jgi:hypothetical protein
MASKMPAALMAKFKGKETKKEEKPGKKMPAAMSKMGAKPAMKMAAKPAMKGKY